MKSRLRTLGLVLLGVLLVLLIAGRYIHGRPKSELEAYKDELRAQGEKLKVDEVLPPPTSPGQNGAEVFRKVRDSYKLVPDGDLLSTVPPMAMRMVAPGRARGCWLQPGLQGESTNSWEDVQTALGAYEKTFEALDKVVDYPQLDFGLDYHGGPRMLLPHLAPLKRTTQLLAAATIYDLHAGNPATAVADVRSMLALVQGMENERLLISQLVRLAMTSIAAAADWELLQATNLDDTSLAALQKDWERLEFIDAYEKNLEMERATVEETFEKWRAAGGRMSVIFGGGGGSGGGGTGDWITDTEAYLKDTLQNAKARTRELRWLATWSYADELQALKGYQILLNTARHARTNQFFQPYLDGMTNQLTKLGFAGFRSDGGFFIDPSGGDLKHFFSSTIGSYFPVTVRVIRGESIRRMMIAAIALKRYQLKYQHYPGTLSELVPEFLITVPIDPMDGQPLRYRKGTGDTFLLYTIGEDGVDNGGDATPTNPKASPNWQTGRDYVWPQPATAEQIESYYQKKR